MGVRVVWLEEEWEEIGRESPERLERESEGRIWRT